MLLNRSKGSELRRYRRVPVDFPARAIINGCDEHHGRLINMSPGDLALTCEARAAIGDAATVYVSGLDSFEGTIARVFPDGFALSFRLSRVRRTQLTERLMTVLNGARSGEDVEAADRRAAFRHPGAGQRVICRLPGGGSLMGRVIDTSVDGVAVDANRRPPVGTDIHVGRLRGVVMRHTARGFVVVYDHSLSPAERPETQRRAG